MTDTQHASDTPELSGGPGADEIRAQLERILASPDFTQSKRLQRFLRHIIEETLAGRGDRLSEYSVGLDVFERDETFDPQTSSIVRVEASRLRNKLEKYNVADGRNDLVRIVLPRGGYAPTFQRAGSGPDAPGEQFDSGPLVEVRRVPRRTGVALLTAAILAVGLTGFLLSDLSPFWQEKQSPADASPSAARTLAVLPLRNLSGDPDEDYFSDGMTDALTTGLAKTGGLRVTSMTSAMAFKNVDRPVGDIARELGVSHVVEGSVLRVNDRVRITAQLIEAGSDRHVWAESYERDVADVLALQNDVVARIVASMTGEAAPPAEPAPRSPPIIEPAAYEAYLRGRFFLSRMTEDGFRKGLGYFKQAIAKAPGYAPAHSGLATCYCLLGGHGFEIVNPHEAMPLAKEAVLEALRLDDTLAEAHAFLGIIRLKYEWDWPGAKEQFMRSIALNPNFAQAHIFYSYYLEAMGQQEAAIGEAESAKELDPLSLAANVNLGWQLLKAGRLEEGKQLFETTAELDPDFWGIHWGLGQYHRLSGDFEAAISEFQKAIAAGGGHAMPLSALGYTYALSGQAAEAEDMLRQLGELSERGYVSAFNMALIYAGTGDRDAAFSSLEKAYADRSRSMAWLNVTAELAPLRSDARFASLLRRVGLVD